MKFEERITEMRRIHGSTVFMKAIHEYDATEHKHGAWLLTFGLLDTFKIVKGISDDDRF